LKEGIARLISWGAANLSTTLTASSVSSHIRLRSRKVKLLVGWANDLAKQPRKASTKSPIFPEKSPSTKLTPSDRVRETRSPSTHSKSSPDSDGAHTCVPDDEGSPTTIVEENEDQKDLVPLFRSVSPSPEHTVQTIDIPYLDYWLREMPKLHPLAPVFPEFFPDLIKVSATTATLRHSLISLSAFVADQSAGKPMFRALLHHQETLHTVQESLSQPEIEEGTIYAVMMLAYFNIFTGKFLSARRHIRGLSLLLQKYSEQGHQPSPTMMLIWRCGVRMDYFLASVYPCKPIFPAPPPEQEDFHRAWIRLCVKKSGKGEEWALAQFALDNLQSRAAHLSWDASQIRKDQGSEEQIFNACAALLDDFTEWRRRELFLEEDEKDSLQRFLHPELLANPAYAFLNYQPLINRNQFYACLLNEFRSALLFVTFIACPIIGKQCKYDGLRMTHAIDSCRSVGALGEISLPVPLVRILQLAGLVFARRERYPKECAWIENQLDILSQRSVIGADKVKEMLQVVWKNNRTWRYEETERMIQNEEDLAAISAEDIV
jgi:hypothetical protein